MLLSLNASSLPAIFKLAPCKSFQNGKGCVTFKKGEVTIAGKSLENLHVIDIPILKEGNIDGILGADILNHFVVYYGFSTKKLWLSPIR